MTAQMIAKIAAFALYLGFMIYIGLKNAKRNNSSSDFFLGGRKVGPWVTALSAEASDSSAWLLMGLPGLCYLGGIKETFWTAIGLIAGTYLNWLFLAKPLRRCTIAFGDSITIPEFLTNRFKDKTHLLSLISVLFIVLFFTIYTASGFVACAKLFNSVFGLPYHAGLAIGLIVILSYTIMGGYFAVCTTDFLQGVLIFSAFVISSVFAICALGGPSEAFAKAAEFSGKALQGEFGEEMLTKFTENKHFSASSVVSALAWGLGYFGMPHIIVRFMGIRSEEELTKARRIGTTWMIISYIGTFLIGTLGTAYLLPKVLSGAAAETVFSETMLKMYPAFIAGIFLCAILAASMSTADSQLLSAASAVSRDLYKGIIKKDADEKSVLNIGRITVLAIAAVAFVLSLNPSSSIFGLVSYAWAGFGATFGPLVLLALFWRGMTNKGAIAGLAAGGITVVLWHNMSGGIFSIYEILPGFSACLLFSVIVSLLDKNKDPEMLAEFDKYKEISKNK
ncbi:sodium/proline symporter PutP [Treponema sp.]|uniref:sodium/proline symporter PutP n=1 Tax=Treponema sp. TaxID=166 RepID=UPI003F0C4634